MTSKLPSSPAAKLQSKEGDRQQDVLPRSAMIVVDTPSLSSSHHSDNDSTPAGIGSSTPSSLSSMSPRLAASGGAGGVFRQSSIPKFKQESPSPQRGWDNKVTISSTNKAILLKNIPTSPIPRKPSSIPSPSSASRTTKTTETTAELLTSYPDPELTIADLTIAPSGSTSSTASTLPITKKLSSHSLPASPSTSSSQDSRTNRNKKQPLHQPKITNKQQQQQRHRMQHKQQQQEQQQQLQQHEITNIRKAITQLMAIPSNRSCADCKSTLIDSSQVYISISPPPPLGDNILRRRRRKRPLYTNHPNEQTARVSFLQNHQAFAPPGIPPKPQIQKSLADSDNDTSSDDDFDDDPMIDPALLASSYLSGHGVFVCALCGAVHKLLGPDIAIVHAAQDPVSWTVEHCKILVGAGGNARCNNVYEAYLQANRFWNDPSSPGISSAIIRRPIATNTPIAERLTFVRAKYQALAYVLPPAIGPLAENAWEQIVSMNHPAVWGNPVWAQSIALNASTVSQLGSVGVEMGRGSGHYLMFEQHRQQLQEKQEKHALSLLEQQQQQQQQPSRQQRIAELPNRLVDHFCVVGASDLLDLSFVRKHSTSATVDGKKVARRNRVLRKRSERRNLLQPVLQSPHDIPIQPVVVDCYPSADFYSKESSQNNVNQSNSNTNIKNEDHSDSNGSAVGSDCFPEHVATFVFPDGCRPSTVQLPPAFYTFVLTNAVGDRLYGAVLRIYDDVRDVDWLRNVFHNTVGQDQQQLEWTCELPTWLVPENYQEHNHNHAHYPHDEVDGNRSTSSSSSCNNRRRSYPAQLPPMRKRTSSQTSESLLFLPKCLVVLSHHPFFELFRKFLLQLYRISLTEAPLPIERFIANFAREVPLPPPGKVQIKFGFTTDDNDSFFIGRPAENQLPMANFSYRPLFAMLSVPNVLVVMGCLMQETRVVLLTKHYSLLGPVAEALLSLLFPFHWHGIYLPLMPFNMLEILEAPVPYLIGLHSKYLTIVPGELRPHGVVFVDLDNDTIHLGCEEGSKYAIHRAPPCFPERQVQKLRAKLIEHASCVYIPPDQNHLRGGMITAGLDTQRVLEQRDSYAYLTAVDSNGSEKYHHNNSLRRKDVFANCDKAYKENELLVPISGFLSERGQFSEAVESPAGGGGGISPVPSGAYHAIRNFSSGSNSDRVGETSLSKNNSTAQKRNFFKLTGKKLSQRRFSSESTKDDNVDINLLDMSEPEGFSSSAIRQAFLRFFVSVFQNYKDYIVDNDSNSNNGFNSDDNFAQFRSTEFINNGIHNLTSGSASFIESITQTQMFQEFVEERRSCPNDAEVLFFDDSITAKQNRSAIGRIAKRQTSFLNDTTSRVTNTYTPPPPSNWGLPDDGRTYSYGTFPKLDPELFGKTRPPMEWAKSNQNVVSLRMTRRGSVTYHKEQLFLRKAMLLPAVTTHTVMKAVTKVGAKNLENAIRLLSTPFASGSPNQPTNNQIVKSGAGDLAKSRHKRKGSDDGSIVSDITLPSAFEFSPEILSNAEEIVMNARRKQAILLGIIIQFQALCRTHLMRIHFYDRIGDGRPDLLAASSFHETRRRNSAAVCIQSSVRSLVIRKRYRIVRKSIICLQSRNRSRTCHIAYTLFIGIISRFQAVVRGHLTRGWLSSLVKARMTLYRSQIINLWRQARTPLSYRTKFWPLIELTSPGLVRLALAEEELARLWSSMNMTVSVLSGHAASQRMPQRDHIQGSMNRVSSRRDFENRLGVSDVCFQQALKNSEMLDMSSHQPRSLGRIRSSFRNGTAKVITAANREEAERLQIYERLCLPNVTEKVLEGYFETFSISQRAGHRKTALAETVWSTPSKAGASARLMNDLFPELIDSTNIYFMPPSKKGSRRFQLADPTPQPLGPSMWAHNRLQERILDHLYLVSDISLRKVPHLLARLSNKSKAQREWFSTYSNRLEAIMKVHGLGSRRDAGYFCMKRFFGGFPSRKFPSGKVISATVECRPCDDSTNSGSLKSQQFCITNQSDPAQTTLANGSFHNSFNAFAQQSLSSINSGAANEKSYHVAADCQNGNEGKDNGMSSVWEIFQNAYDPFSEDTETDISNNHDS